MGLCCLVGIVFYSVVFAVDSSDKADAGKTMAVSRTIGGRVDMCLGCHKEKPDKAHAREVLGCAVCHKGNPLAGDVTEAHRGMILNPGELRFAGETCGQIGCHPREVKWVKNSLMATNRGIISTLRYYWGETNNHSEDISVEYLKKTGLDSPAIDYYRKLCGSCHLWVERRTLPDFLARKGGGCTACHLAPPPEGTKKAERHPFVTRNIPMKNCIRCHNRSGRIGLSYQGEFETDGYGTPLEGGHLNNKVLKDGRFVQNLPEDVHHKAGLVCIDCHTQREVMGDGHKKAHFEEQLEISCGICHGDKKALMAMYELNKSNDETLYPKGDKIPPYPRLKIDRKDGKFFLVGKNDKKLHELKDPNPVSCENPSHKRLSCQACHSTWVPQCYGCHVRNDEGQSQLDKVANKVTTGSWKEFKGFMRFGSPVLGVLDDLGEKGGDVGDKGKVVILVPG